MGPDDGIQVGLVNVRNEVTFDIHDLVRLGLRHPERVPPEMARFRDNHDHYAHALSEFKAALAAGAFGGRSVTEVAFVFGTTRHNPSDCLHPGYVSDAMYVPEIAQALRDVHPKVRVSSMLDVDVEPADERRMNFVVCGDGEVNALAWRLLSLTEGAFLRYARGDLPFFTAPAVAPEGAGLATFSRLVHHAYGAVHLFRNPRNPGRFVLHVGGIGPVGTIAALRWLADKLAGQGQPLPDLPFAVVRGVPRPYGAALDGYERHCAACSRVEEPGGVYWRGRIDNVIDARQVFPPVRVAPR